VAPAGRYDIHACDVGPVDARLDIIHEQHSPPAWVGLPDRLVDGVQAWLALSWWVVLSKNGVGHTAGRATLTWLSATRALSSTGLNNNQGGLTAGGHYMGARPRGAKRRRRGDTGDSHTGRVLHVPRS
jgi:hypothetical protein